MCICIYIYIYIYIYECVRSVISSIRLRMCSRYSGREVLFAAPPREAGGIALQYLCDEFGSCQTFTKWLSSPAVSKLPEPRFRKLSFPVDFPCVDGFFGSNLSFMTNCIILTSSEQRGEPLRSLSHTAAQVKHDGFPICVDGWWTTCPH